MRTILLLLAIAAGLAAQETRKEIVNAAPAPADDAKGNSDKVPDVYAIKGQFDRILVLRFKFDANKGAARNTLQTLDQIAQAHSDTESARHMQEAKRKLFPGFRQERRSASSISLPTNRPSPKVAILPLFMMIGWRAP